MRPSGPPEPGQDHLFYVIGRSDMGGMSIDPYRAYLKKDGTIGSNFGPFERRSSWAARNLTAQDAGLLGKIAFFCGDGYEPGNGWPEGAELVDLLREIVETGRARMGDIHGMALAWGAPRAVGFLWEVDEAGAQRLAARDGDGAAVTVLPFPTPFFVNAETGETGVAETAIPPDMASWLASAPPVPREAADAVASKMSRIGQTASVPLLERVEERTGVAPEPVLILYGRERNVTDRIVAWVRGQPRSYRLGCIDAVLGLGR